MKSIIFSIYCENISKEMLQMQKAVVDKFRPKNVEFIQVKSYVPKKYLDFVRYFNAQLPASVHSDGLNECIKKHLSSYDVFVILDIDCIPISFESIPYLIRQASDNVLVGTAHSWLKGDKKGGVNTRITHLDLKDHGHVYVAPFAMAISNDLYKKLGINFAQNETGDVAENITFKSEDLGIPIDFIWPTKHEEKDCFWPLKPGIITGGKATYGNCRGDLFWHLLCGRFTHRQNMFIEKCKEILGENAIDRT